MVVENIEDKIEGYPKLAAVMNSDPNFANFRKFEYVRTRLLLHKQANLGRLLACLNELDEKAYKDDPFVLQTTNLEQNSEHVALLTEIERELRDYDELLLRQQKIKAMKCPHPRNYHSLYNYIWQERVLAREEAQIFFRKDDFVSIASGQQSTWLEGMVGDILNWFPKEITQKIFTTPEQRMRSSTGDIRYFSRERISMLSKSITFLVISALLMIPTPLVMNYTQSTKILIALLFTLTFSNTCTTAAYCIVLVILLGNLKAINLNGPDPSNG